MWNRENSFDDDDEDFEADDDEDDGNNDDNDDNDVMHSTNYNLEFWMHILLLRLGCLWNLFGVQVDSVDAPYFLTSYRIIISL